MTLSDELFREYAVEPSALSSLESVRYFLDAFGPWRGRLLAKYPSQWRRYVYDVARRLPDGERKRIEIRLQALDKRAFSARSGAKYNPAQPWLDNAIEEHRRSPFFAIINQTWSDQSVFMKSEDVSDADPRWFVEPGRVFERSSADIANWLRLLLEASSRVLIIDPYFDAGVPSKLGQVTDICSAVPWASATVEIHTTDRHITITNHGERARRLLGPRVPRGFKVTIRCWCQCEMAGDSSCRSQSGRGRFHNRYILSEIGGVQFGDGIERGAAGELDRVSILSDADRLRLFDLYANQNPDTFDESGDPIEIVGTKP